MNQRLPLNGDVHDIVLAVCPFCSLDTPPAGMASLLAALRSRGFEAVGVDLNAEAHRFSSPELEPFWDLHRVPDLVDADRFSRQVDLLSGILDFCCRRLSSYHARAFGFTIFNTNVRFTALVADRLRQAGTTAPVIFGGPSCSVPGERRWLDPGSADILVAGDGEELLPDVVRSLCGSTALEHPSVCNSGHCDRPDQLTPAVVHDLDSWPSPDYGSADLTLYRRRDPEGRRMLPVVGSRGCIMRCAFCNDHTLGGPFRVRNPENVFREMERHAERYGTRTFVFNDLVMNGRLDVLERLSDLIIDSGLPLRWLGQGIPRGDMSDRLLARLRRSGLEMITFGVESGSDAIRARMKKTARLVDPAHALRNTHLAGIRTAINLMVGFPGETESEFTATLDFLDRHRDLIDEVENVHMFYITPMSPIDRSPESFGISTPGDSPLERSTLWKGMDGSTYDLRRDRLLRLVSFVEDLGITIDTHRMVPPELQLT